MPESRMIAVGCRYQGCWPSDRFHVLGRGVVYIAKGMVSDGMVAASSCGPCAMHASRMVAGYLRLGQ